MDSETLGNLGLVLLFVLIGGVFAATEIALVSLRESQLSRMEETKRGAKTAAVARDPNRFLAAVQIGVTVAGFFSAAYGGSTLAPDFVPALTSIGLNERVAETVALVTMTLLIAYFSLVLGELVPKRLALQRSAGLSVLVAPALDKFATAMRPMIWLLSVSTNAVVRLLGGDPAAKNEQMSEEEVRDLVTGHEALDEDERRIVGDVFSAANRSVKEVMRPRGEVAFLDRDLPLDEAVRHVRERPFSRYPVIGENVDDIVGFLHVRDLLDARETARARTVADIMRTIVALPATNALLPSLSNLRKQGAHIAVVIDEYGGTDGIVTLEDMVEELVGEIHDEYDPETEQEQVPDTTPGSTTSVDGGLNIEDFAEQTGIELADGPYETVAGYVINELGRLPDVGDTVTVENHQLEVTEVTDRRISALQVSATGSPTLDGPDD